ncbi:hypothetical protein GDO78_020641 [Eleutherodactylus coqui]|uniref:Anaphylatoxin-like domain-containing protein n=1 Tax=Eleutherodactylus coqui TaxID=57060 RepID=A0A8J6EI05_ELECQ|nr:hypothetical protein GDO78_020641 [Eleutherodactylus coqui]
MTWLQYKCEPCPEISPSSFSPALVVAAPEMILLQTALLLLLYGKAWGRRLVPHVTAPETWRLGVPESVFIRASQQLESFPVKVSVVSYPDKTMTFSSALLRLTPENRFRGSVTLSITAEDSPGEFVDLVVESEAFRKEMRIPVTGATQSPRNQPDKTAIRRRRRRSVLTEEQTAELTSKFKDSKIQRCCRDGIDHYSQHYTCENESNEELKRRKPKCYKVYEFCCNFTENEHGYKPVTGVLSNDVTNIKYELIPAISTHKEEAIVITVTQTTGRGRVTSTFTVKVDPTEDVSVQLSGKMFETNIAVSPMTPPPAEGDQ